MDRFFYDLYQAAIDHPNIQAGLWGPGFEGFNDELTLTENVAMHFNNCEDLLFVYLHTGNDDPRSGKKMGWDWTAHNRCLLVEELGDCHGGECISSSIPSANITILRYGFQLLHNFYPQSQSGAKLYAHNPDCANPSQIQPIAWEEKEDIARLFGSLDPRLYPLRSTIFWGIADGTINAQHYVHPGYEFRSTYVYQEYTKALSRSKVCIFDSSIVKKAIRKFMEAFMAGCVVASDLPHEMGDLIKNSIIELDAADNTTVIATKINAAMADQHMLREKAARAIQVAMTHWTCAHKFDRLLGYADEYAHGFRGYSLPYSIKLGCNSFQGNGKRAAWCS